MKQHPVYDHLWVCENGDVWSSKSNKFLRFWVHKNGYLVHATRLNGRKSKPLLLRAHRLVAETYLENKEGKPFVNHKDSCKTNNHVSNLEWCTAKENAQHYLKTKTAALVHLNKSRYGESYSGVLTEDVLNWIALVYEPRSRTFGLREIGRKLGVCHSSIVTALRSHLKKTKES